MNNRTMHDKASPHERLAPGLLTRHRHAAAYAALVLDGGYVEAGEHGRWYVTAGDVLVHGPFSIHANWVDRTGARVINLPLKAGPSVPPAFRTGDARRLLELAAAGGTISVLDVGTPLAPLQVDWPDALAAALRTDPGLSLRAWCQRAGLAPATVSRGFGATYGVTPARYRADVRLARALRRLDTGQPLASLAHESGFADQAHLSRAVREATGLPPARLRKSILFKTGSGGGT
jgi:AraC-like DNA-binding protein